MMESEKKIFEMMNKKAAMSKYWMPLVWATNIINRARKESLITSDQVVQTLLVELSDIRKRLGALIGYDTVCVPLVYTQVICLLYLLQYNTKFFFVPTKTLQQRFGCSNQKLVGTTTNFCWLNSNQTFFVPIKQFSQCKCSFFARIPFYKINILV